MTKPNDLRWREVTLVHVYDVEVAIVANVLGASKRSVQRWYEWLLSRGSVEGKGKKQKSSRWSSEVCQFVAEYAESHPCFYIDELRSALKARFPTLRNTSEATICRALRFDLHLTRKLLSKRAREAAPAEIAVYYNKLLPFYSGPEQLVFLDETAKAGRDYMRRYA
ncbi:hypothetical protein PR003_g8167 [Phytophthora rubi]|uniref:Tc1-like transposase DDE domain-containing protein n=1 Tax=Phytophthora rubi TaxID=129364 RepID=A0A6A4FYC7_9STRA|nr:hypothetical protein PR003_g8167 [Phytophthora rubi]